MSDDPSDAGEAAPEGNAGEAAPEGHAEAAPPERSALEAHVLRLADQRGPGKTICPTEAARASADADGLAGEAWRGRLKAVRSAAVRLANTGAVAIYRKGKPVDPDDFKGVYRIGLPPEA